MNKKRLTVLAGLSMALCIAAGGFAQKNHKLAQEGMQFLSVGADARAAAVAGAVFTQTELKSSNLFFNPACMAYMPGLVDVSASQNKWIADINHNAFSAAIRPLDGKYGVLGVSVLSVDYGTLYGTRVNKFAETGYDDTGDFSPSALSLGVGYAKDLTDRFAVGGQVKWVRQSLGENVIPEEDSTVTVKNEITPMAFDFGTLYRTGFKSLVFGMSVRNFSPQVKFAEDPFELPLTFTMGISIDLADFIRLGEFDQSCLLSVNATHFRSHPEQVCVGLDYRLLKTLSLRGGYVYGNDEDDFSFGLGISRFGFTLDYAYTPFGVFDNVQRLTARFSM